MLGPLVTVLRVGGRKSASQMSGSMHGLLPLVILFVTEVSTGAVFVPRLIPIGAGEAAALTDASGRQHVVHVGDTVGDWTLMHVTDGPEPTAVLEDFVHRDDGRILYIDVRGVVLALPKTAETTADLTGGRFLGHTAEEIKASPTDLLGEQILASGGDPRYADVARAFAPITRVQWGTFDFVGTPDTFDKVWFNYGGRSPNFDPAIYQPSIDDVRKAGKVWNGLVGSWLPVLRFVYPETDGAWTEMLAFAPFAKIEGNDRIQPVWYRVSRIEGGRLRWSRHVDTYVAFPMRDADNPRLASGFYVGLRQFESDWRSLLAASIRIELPDERMENMARFGLVRSIMTRIGDFPKYGVLDRNYGGSEHDGFPDTFTVETTAMIEWGLLDRAGRYIDNYFAHFVRDDGSLVYRGPETGQYGRMLTIVALFVRAGGDAGVLRRHRSKLDGITDLLLDLRATARRLPTADPAHGMIAAWSEADSVLEAEPERYMRPYFSNSTEAARGFRELGAIWTQLGESRGDTKLAAQGRRLESEGDALARDIETAIGKSLLRVDGETVLPSIAGAPQAFHRVVAIDPTDPQHRAYRANMEMLYSGLLTPEQANLVIDYRARHHDQLLGVPTAYGYNTGEMAGFLSYGHAYGLLQQDRIREALLLLYSVMAHQYTRGSWLAPETRRPLLDAETAPYCTPAQLVASLVVRWLLVFEDPRSATLWLGKGLPRDWLAHGNVVDVQDVPTRWGRIGYRIESRVKEHRIDATVSLPAGGMSAPTLLRLRAPDGLRLKAVNVDGRAWTAYDPEAEVVVLQSGLGGTLRIDARYGTR